MKIFVPVILFAFTVPAFAQEPPKDRKDWAIEALVSQRNDALNKAAGCDATSNERFDFMSRSAQDTKSKLDAANKTIATLQAELDKLKPKPAE